MHPVIRTIGKVLRLVGISSPEDSETKKVTAGDPPSWKAAKSPAQKSAGVETSQSE